MSEKFIVCQGATVYCSRSMSNNSPQTAVPLIINSQTSVTANGNKLVATEKDCQLINMNFGMCNDPKYPNVKPPCMAQVQWTKVHQNIEVGTGKLKILTEKSEGICTVCSVPGKIRIARHGQVATITSEMMVKAPENLMAVLCPLGDISENEQPIVLKEI